MDGNERKGSTQEPQSYPVYLQCYLPITIFFNGYLYGPYLGKYERDWNETWFMDRWQWEEVQHTRTITLPCILLSYLPLTIFFINGCLSCNILESKNGIEIKLGTYIDVNGRKYRRQEP